MNDEIETSPKAYATIKDVAEQVIAPSLGDYAAEYDVTGIAHALYSYDTEAQGFVLADEDADFWATAGEFIYYAVALGEGKNIIYGNGATLAEQVTDIVQHLMECGELDAGYAIDFWTEAGHGPSQGAI